MSEDNVNVSLSGSVQGLVAAMHAGAESVAEATESMKLHMEALTTAVETVQIPFIALLALLVGGEMFERSIEKVAELAVELEVLSQKTGETVEQLSALQYAADLSHVSTENLTIGLQRLARGMEGAAKGTGPAYDALHLLGLRATEANGSLVPLNTMLLRIADEFHGMEDGAGKTAIAMDLFGRSGATLIPFLNKGAEGIHELEEEARKLGVTFDEHGVRTALEYEDAMKKVHAVVDSMERTLALALMPTLTQLADAFTETAHKSGLLVMAGHAIGDTLKGAAIVANDLSLAVNGVRNALLSLSDPQRALKQMETDFKSWKETLDRLSKEDTGLDADPALAATLNGKKRPAPIVTAKDKGPSELERWRDEWNTLKEGMIGSDADLLAEEIKFWSAKLSLVTKGTKEEIEIHAKVVELKVQQSKKEEQEEKRAAQEREHAWLQTFESLPRSWDGAMRSMRSSTQGFGDFFREMLRELGMAYAAFEAKTIIVHNAAWLEKRKMSVLGWAAEAMESTWATLKIVANYAAQAAAGAWAAIAGIPVVGPVLAPVIAAGTLAGVMALAGSLKSAHGGYDIPAGTNPLTQLHAQEMVLPAELANKVRGMTDGGAGGGDTHNHFHISAIDHRGMRELFLEHSDALADGAAKAVRDGRLTPKKMGMG